MPKTKRIQTYENAEIEVTFNPNVCIHAAVCLRELPSVFDVSKRRWIQLEGAPPERVLETVAQCPSGALAARTLMDGESAQEALRDCGQAAAEEVRSIDAGTAATPEEGIEGFSIDDEQARRIGEFIASESSPVGIDAKKTHVVILAQLEAIEERLRRIEDRLAAMGY